MMSDDVHTYNLELSSERSSISQVAPFLRATNILDSVGASRYHDMLVSVTEAVNNAIIHGNECIASKSVNIDVRVHQNEVVIIIRDQGHGFNADDVADPRTADHLLKEGGRGVFLIRHLSDVAEFYNSNPGMSVLIKYFIA